MAMNVKEYLWTSESELLICLAFVTKSMKFQRVTAPFAVSYNFYHISYLWYSRWLFCVFLSPFSLYFFTENSNQKKPPLLQISLISVFLVSFCKNHLPLMSKLELFHNIMSFSHNFGLDLSLVHSSRITLFKHFCYLGLMDGMFKTKLLYLWLSVVGDWLLKTSWNSLGNHHMNHQHLLSPCTTQLQCSKCKIMHVVAIFTEW